MESAKERETYYTTGETSLKNRLEYLEDEHRDLCNFLKEFVGGGPPGNILHKIELNPVAAAAGIMTHQRELIRHIYDTQKKSQAEIGKLLADPVDGTGS